MWRMDSDEFVPVLVEVAADVDGVPLNSWSSSSSPPKSLEVFGDGSFR